MTINAPAGRSERQAGHRSANRSSPNGQPDALLATLDSEALAACALPGALRLLAGHRGDRRPAELACRRETVLALRLKLRL